MAYDLTLRDLTEDPESYFELKVCKDYASMLAFTSNAPIEDVGNEINVFGLILTVSEACKSTSTAGYITRAGRRG